MDKSWTDWTTWNYVPKRGGTTNMPVGRPLLTWHPDAGFRIMTLTGSESDGWEWWCSMDADNRYLVVGPTWAPTHWRPLPPAPVMPEDV